MPESEHLFSQRLLQRLQAHQQAGLHRQRLPHNGPCAVAMQRGNKSYLAFCSNDYLGLANHPAMIESFCDAAKTYGVGSGASHLVSGHSDLHHHLEAELAAFTGREKALVFSSGYMANLAVLQALLGKQDAVLEDRLNHASLLDAGLLSGARFRRYQHNDMDSLQQHLQKIDPTVLTLIVSDGVFSMDGDIAPLDKMAKLAEDHNAVLMIDDAHGFGVLGELGGGCAELFGLNQQRLPILMATFGKALGSSGAFVAGSATLIETLVQFARPYIYTTALPPAQVAATRRALKLLNEESWRRENLNNNIHYFRQQALARGLPITGSATAIQPMIIGSTEKLISLAAYLEEQGIWVGTIRPPTVPRDTARLRITLSASHQQSHIDQLLDVLSHTDLVMQ